MLILSTLFKHLKTTISQKTKPFYSFSYPVVLYFVGFVDCVLNLTVCHVLMFWSLYSKKKNWNNLDIFQKEITYFLTLFPHMYFSILFKEENLIEVLEYIHWIVQKNVFNCSASGLN